MVQYAFEVILTVENEDLKNNILDFIQSKKADMRRIKVDGLKIIFRGEVSQSKAIQIRDWIKIELQKLDNSKFFAQLWYAKIGFKTEMVEKERLDENGEIEKYIKEIDVPRMEEGKEIEVGTLGVTVV